MNKHNAMDRNFAQAITEPIIESYMDHIGELARAKIHIFVYFPAMMRSGGLSAAMHDLRRHSEHDDLMTYLERLNFPATNQDTNYQMNAMNLKSYYVWTLGSVEDESYLKLSFVFRENDALMMEVYSDNVHDSIVNPV